MSKSVESESDDDDCEYFLQPTCNQYNITDKIKEANQQLYKSETNERLSQPKVRFKESVDFEPDDDIDEVMENRSVASSVARSAEESSDDGYIDDDNSEAAATIEEIVENDEENDEVNYEKSDFHEEENVTETEISAKTETSDSNNVKHAPKKKQTFRPKSSRVSPGEEPDEKIIIDDKKRSKYCCQFKNEYNMKLPKYSGFNSNYGLSKEEIAKREYVKHKSDQHKQFRQAQQLEEQEDTAQKNEEAFAKWLSKKMCNTVNKSNPTNMFDAQASTKNFRRFPKQL